MPGGREGAEPIQAHALGRLRPALHRSLFWVGLGLCTLALWGLFWLDPRPPSGSALRLSGAGSLEDALRIVGRWSAGDFARARWWLTLDVVFVPVYVTTLCLACLWPLRAPSRPGVRATLAWVAVAGGLADLVENAALYAFLSDGRPPGAIDWIRAGRLLKFGGFAAAAVTGLVVLGVAVLRWLRGMQDLPPNRPDLEQRISALDAQAQASSSTRVARVAATASADPSPGELVAIWLLAQRIEPQVDPPEPAIRAEEPRLGVCCSGGGIRSAAYNLGALQELDRAGELRRSEYLSAVSGGSYIAAAHEIVRARSEPALFDPALGSSPFAPGSPEEEHLRNRTTYLAPGAGGTWALVWRLLRGLAVNLFVIGGVVVLAGFLYGALIVRHLFDRFGCLPKRVCPPSYSPPAWVWWFIAVTAGIAVAVGIFDVLRRPRKDSVARFLEGWSLRLVNLALVSVLLLLLVPWTIPEALQRGLVVSIAEGRYRVNLGAAAAVVAGWATLLGTIAGALGLRSLGLLRGRKPAETPTTPPKERRRGILAKVRTFAFRALVAIIGPILVSVVFTVYVFVGAMQGTTFRVQWRMVVTAVLLVAALSLGDLTRWSMHPFYKRRLSSAFVLERKTLPNGTVVATEVPYDELVRFTDLQPGRPELVVCAAANVSDYGATPPSRSAVSFTMSRGEVSAGRLFGHTMPMDVYQDAVPYHARDITVPTAVAISGAALSPSMGKQSRRWLRFLLAVANVRLGVWLPNPRAVRRQLGGGRPVPRRAGPRYLLWELLGRNSYRNDYIYVTDGGHVENLGLVELLRRGCTHIYCFDASGDETDTFNTLGQAIAMARSELGVEIEIDPFVMAPRADEAFVARDHVSGEIWFAGDREDGREPGRLVVAKAGVTVEAPADIRAFMQLDREFPTHGTASQLYTEERFEAYRALGAFTARGAIAEMKGS